VFKKIRVLVVDDSALVRSLLKDIIDRQSDMECIGVANDPLIAREMIRELDPDVITLDVEMPRMDGLDFLGKLMRLRPTPVVMISTLTKYGADVTLRALELGAVDFVAKPRMDPVNGFGILAAQIVDKVRVAASARIKRLVSMPVQHLPQGKNGDVGPVLSSRYCSRTLVFVGASTGGTEALKKILAKFPVGFPAVVITQHMPPGFTATFAARLNSMCQIAVQEAKNGERILPGRAYIAPGGSQLSVRRNGDSYVTVVEDSEPVNRHRPSVEVLFKSAARVVGRYAYGLMLTGMGDDGAKAMREMRDAGSYNFVQDEDSCVVFGMPRAAILQGAADEVLPLSDLADALMERVKIGP